MPLQATSGAASYDAFGGGVIPYVPIYIEDVFSTYLYTGNGSTQTITNNIDLSSKGGLVWHKPRSNASSHLLFDTQRGVLNSISSDATTTQTSLAGSLTAFNNNGFSLGTRAGVNQSATTYVTWTFREQLKFFDVVTYTGTGATGQVISHNLGSVPACIIIKRTSGTADWYVWHKDLTSTSYALLLNSTSAEFTGGGFLTGTPTSTTFSLKPPSSFDPNGVNGNGSTYVAYLFAHDAGGFGLTGTDNVISCGKYTGNGATDGPTVTVGFEPQWVMIKSKNSTANFRIIDTIRGFSVTGNTMSLFPNTTGAENTASTSLVRPTATGFKLSAIDGDTNASGTEYIYIAIRRGPMKVPTSGTSVYNGITWSGNDVTGRTLAHGLSSPPDLSITNWRNGLQENLLWDKLRGLSTTIDGFSVYLRTQSVGGNGPISDYYYTPNMVNVAFGATASNSNQINGVSSTMVGWNFRRAPSFMDIVCYTGTGVARTINHNLTTVPQMMIVKLLTGGSNNENWNVYHVSLGNTSRVMLDNNTAVQSGLSVVWNSTTPTSSVFSVGTNNQVNLNNATFVAYLFATCAGVSKVGSYTGTGALQTVNCGFTSGARFVLIKRTDTTGNWWTYDSARGITSGSDPYLFLNTIDSEGTGTNYVDTDTTGFKVTAAAPAGLNASGGTYIFLAIA